MNEDWNLEDLAWIARIQEGDEAAARAMVHRLYPTVIKSVRAHLPRRSSEGDLAQAAFLKIFKHFSQFSGRVPLEHWVSRITVNTCMTELRREFSRPELRMSDLTEGEEQAVHCLISSAEELSLDQSQDARELVKALLARLKPDERLVITMLHLDERSVGEIARLTGWSISRVKVKAFRARLKMRKLWEQLLARQPAGAAAASLRTEPETSFNEALAAVGFCAPA
jgi:RNA polymerase sigma-70 factor (ECF subfamily)